MRIFQYDANQSFDNIDLFFTKEEAESLIDYLQYLLKHPEAHHFHLRSNPEDNFPKEITVAIYSKDNINIFDERSQKLIKEDK